MRGDQVLGSVCCVHVLAGMCGAHEVVVVCCVHVLGWVRGVHVQGGGYVWSTQ